MHQLLRTEKFSDRSIHTQERVMTRSVGPPKHHCCSKKDKTPQIHTMNPWGNEFRIKLKKIKTVFCGKTSKEMSNHSRNILLHIHIAIIIEILFFSKFWKCGEEKKMVQITFLTFFNTLYTSIYHYQGFLGITIQKLKIIIIFLTGYTI